MAATERGVSAVYLGDGTPKLINELREEYPRAEIVAEKGGFSQWVEEIVARAEGSAPRRELPLDLQATTFQRRVWQELQRIPRGTTRTYSQIARAVGKPRAVQGGGASVRDKSGFNCCAVPSRGARRRTSGGIPVGPFAKREVAGAGESLVLFPTQQSIRALNWREKFPLGSSKILTAWTQDDNILLCAWALAARFNFGSVLGPVGFETGFVDL